jgi:hypothetical protein
MPKAVFTDQEHKTFELVQKGDYRFEVTGVKLTVGERDWGKLQVKGKQVIEAELTILKGDTNEQVGRVYDDFPFGVKELQYKLDTFAKSTDMRMENGELPKKGEALDFSEETLLGLRGWATVGVRDYNKTELIDSKPVVKTKQANEVERYITNKPKIARNAPTPQAETNEFGI